MVATAKSTPSAISTRCRTARTGPTSGAGRTIVALIRPAERPEDDDELPRRAGARLPPGSGSPGASWSTRRA